MLIVLDVSLGIVHFLIAVCYYILVASYHIGRFIFCVICRACRCIGGFCSIVAIIAEEFYGFTAALYKTVSASVGYVRLSTNAGIVSFLEFLVLFYTHVTEFLKSTKETSKKLGAGCAHYVVETVFLLKCSLLLIADWAWWLSTILPRIIYYCVIAVGDFLVIGVSATVLLLTSILQSIVDDIFRYATALLVIILISKNLSRLHRLTIRSLMKIKNSIVLRRDFQALRMIHIERFMALPSSTNRNIPSNNAREKLLQTQQCVICYDRAKCVLFLPCRHLCMCEICADNWMNVESVSAARCPLCRTNILQSMPVYI